MGRFDLASALTIDCHTGLLLWSPQQYRLQGTSSNKWSSMQRCWNACLRHYSSQVCL